MSNMTQLNELSNKASKAYSLITQSHHPGYLDNGEAWRAVLKALVKLKNIIIDMQKEEEQLHDIDYWLQMRREGLGYPGWIDDEFPETENNDC